jgi:ribosomal protein S18 acetylase RimI-like enzyme
VDPEVGRCRPLAVTEPLDRPIWHALHSRQSTFSAGGPLALRYQVEVSPFAAAVDDSADALAALAAVIPPAGSILLLQAGVVPLPPGTMADMVDEGVQMVAGRLEPPHVPPGVVDLGDADEMLELATLTRPGPFLSRTHRLGGFVGIREDGRLIAMAGERMKLPGFTEVSGVCTHPDYRGRGHAGLLSRIVAARVAARGETPFLHAFANNHAAIRLYEQLGFVLRRRMSVVALRREAT